MIGFSKGDENSTNVTSTLCPRCGDPPEHVRCHDRKCPTRARCCGQGCSRCMRGREEANYLYLEDMDHGD